MMTTEAYKAVHRQMAACHFQEMADDAAGEDDAVQEALLVFAGESLVSRLELLSVMANRLGLKTCQDGNSLLVFGKEG